VKKSGRFRLILCEIIYPVDKRHFEFPNIFCGSGKPFQHCNYIIFDSEINLLNINTLMKKIYSILSIVTFSISCLSAQITIFSDDIQPIGSIASQSADSDPDQSIQPGDTGEQTWDFSLLTNEGALEYSFIDPSTTPYFDLYPSSNVASAQANNYFYFTQDDSELAALGTYGDFNYQSFVVTAAVTIDPPQSLLRFPVALDDSFTQTIVQTAQAPGSSIGFPYDSVRIERTVDRTVTIDAYGMMTTPLNTFETLRSTEVEFITDELFGLSFGNWQSLATEPTQEFVVYNWWTKDGNFGFPVVQLQTNPVDGVTGANWVTDFVSDAEEAFDLEFSLYPNPAPSNVFVEFPEFFEGSLEVVNIHGQSVLSQAVSNSKEMVSTQNLLPGSYILVVRNVNGNMTAAKRFEVLR
jgi:hypothetical protein